MNKLYSFILLMCMVNVGVVTAQPANDNCADAIVVGYGTHDLLTLGATTDGPDQPNCTGYSFGDDQCHLDVWYSITAENDGFIELSTSLTEVIPPDPPANSNCADGELMNVITSSQSNDDDSWTMGNNSDAPSITTEPTCRPFGEFYDVWYRFNSGSNEELEVVFEPLTPDAQFIFELWEGDCSAAALPMDSVGGTFSPQTCWNEEETIAFEWLIEGFPGEDTEYLVRVSTYVTGQLPGEFRFQLIGDEGTISGIEEFEETDFSVFPNPSNGQFTINSNVSVNSAVVSLIDLQGRTVHSEVMNINKNRSNEIAITIE